MKAIPVFDTVLSATSSVQRNSFFALRQSGAFRVFLNSPIPSFVAEVSSETEIQPAVFKWNCELEDRRNRRSVLASEGV